MKRRYSFAKVYFTSYVPFHLVHNLNNQVFSNFFFHLFAACVQYFLLHCHFPVNILVVYIFAVFDFFFYCFLLSTFFFLFIVIYSLNCLFSFTTFQYTFLQLLGIFLNRLIVKFYRLEQP